MLFFVVIIIVNKAMSSCKSEPQISSNLNSLESDIFFGENVLEFGEGQK